MKGRVLFDPGSLVVVAITLVLFVWALFEKGLTHDLLLEAGVFMVSVKLIIMSYKNSLVAASIDAKLDTIATELTRQRQPADHPASPAASDSSPAIRRAGSGPARP
ncbi:MAG TPA: hypothetical protein VEW27_02615 [Methylomirabilota bacterium]|nr:hypothetical protein [Methylomirabilota bacterium]